MAEGGSEEKKEIAILKDLREFDLSDIEEEGKTLMGRVLSDLSKVKTFIKMGKNV